MSRKIVFKKILIITFCLLSTFIINQPAFCSTQAVEYLCELGIAFYRLGRYNDALIEFNKALLLEPDNQTAKKYIDNIFKETSPVKKPSREEVIEETLNQLAKKEEPTPIPEEEIKPQEERLKISGQTQLSIGITPQDAIWKQANFDLNERNWRMLSVAAFNNRENTYDTRIYDDLRLNLDTHNPEGFNFHSNISIDPWSFMGKSKKITIGSGGGGSDYAEVELKYWSNTRYTINETIFTLEDGASIAVPEIKVVDGKTASTPVSTTFDASLTIPELKIERQFQPLRELWFDYVEPEYFKIRFFPIAYQDQALTSDDPLKLSNNHIWWEESPWLDRWRPGTFNSGASPDDFSKGEFDDAISFFTRDSEGIRLTALRGLAFSYEPQETTSFNTTFASPKTLWQDYDSFDNFISAARLKHSFRDNLSLGSTYTFRIGLNEDQNNKKDITNHVVGLDLAYEIMEGFKLSLEAAQSFNKQDLTSPGFASKLRGNAYYFSLVNRFPRDSIMDLKYGYDEIKSEKDESFFAKSRFFFAHMDEGFNPSLATYRETRDDAFWSRHIHFRKPFQYWYSGLYRPTLKWEDIEPFRIGNGIDIGRDVVGFRLETSFWDKTLDNLFDVRNVHSVDGKFVENVARDEFTYKANDKLTTKLLAIYHKLPKSKGGIDPFIFDSDTGEYALDVSSDPIDDGKNLSLKTGSLGLEYAFCDWLSINGIWEYTNDYTLAYDNYPRGNLNNTNFSTFNEYDKVFRKEVLRVFDQSLFPQPPYPFYDIFKTGLRLNPLKNLEIYLDYTRNEFNSAGQIDDNMNHIGLEVSYRPSKKFGFYTRYTYSRWNDLTLMRQGYSKYYLGRHNFFSEFRYLPNSDDEFVLQYGESGRSPAVITSFDPFGSSLSTLDTQHIFRIYYRRKF